jgi:hypothetical protein
LREIARLGCPGDRAGSVDGDETAVPLKIKHKNIYI